MSDKQTIVTSGRKQSLKFEYSGVSEDNQKVAYIRICHYPDFKIKQK